MSRLRKRLTARERDLDAWLAEADAMLLSELDGYLAGLHVCPDLLLPSEWLGGIWARHPDPEGAEDGGAPDEAFAFESDEEAEEVIGLIMFRYNAIATDLQRGRYTPLFDIDERNGDVMWEPWIEGFQQALALRPEAWDAALQAEEAVLEAIGGLLTLSRVARDESDLEAEEINTLTDAAPDLIAVWIDALHAWRLSRLPNVGDHGSRAAASKVGRNDPCPCGSGKKYKKCCGAA